AVASPPSRAVANGRWANPAVGLGLAASVAVAALFTVRAMNEAESVGETPAQVLSAIVPTNSAPSANVVAPLPPIRLTNYLLHHGEYAGLSRTSVHSTVVGSMEQSFLVDAVIVNDASPSPAERDAR